jgi:hypothetical protein
MSLILRSIAGIICLCMIADAQAQRGNSPFKTPAEERTQSPEQITASQPEHVIEVRTVGGCLFAPVNARWNRGFLLYTLPRPASFTPDSFGHPAVSTVTFFAKLRGELWDVDVVAGSGEFYDADRQQIATVRLATNGRAEIPQLDALGLGAFRVGVVKVLGQASAKPYVVNKTRSISLEKLEDQTLPGPFVLSLKNDSDKDVLAIQYNIYKDQKFLFLKWLGKRLPAPLIKKGEVYKLEVPSEDITCADGDGYRPAQSNRVDLVSAIFSDGSYEGEPGLAALIRGKAVGNRALLERTVAVMDNLSGGDGPSVDVILFQLKYLYEGMSEMAEPAMIETLQNGLPRGRSDSTAALGSFIRAGQHEVKTSLMADARWLEEMNKHSAPLNQATNVEDWWERTHSKYKEWLALVEKVTAP